MRQNRLFDLAHGEVRGNQDKIEDGAGKKPRMCLLATVPLLGAEVRRGWLAWGAVGVVYATFW